MNPVSISRLPIGPDTSSIDSIVFLKRLTSGKHLELFVYTDPLKIRYYYSYTGRDSAAELINRPYLRPDRIREIRDDRLYVRQLMTEAMKLNLDVDYFNREIINPDYTAPVLLKMVNYINGNSVSATKVKMEIAETDKPRKIEAYIGGGAQYSRIILSGNGDLAANASKASSLAPFLRAGADLFFNRYVRKTGLRLDITFSSLSGDIHGKTKDAFPIESTLEIKRNSAGASLQLFKKLYNKPDFALPVFAGIRFNYHDYSRLRGEKVQTVYSQTTVIPEKYKFSKLTYDIPVGLGIEVRKVEFFATYNVKLSPLEDYMNMNLSIPQVQTGVVYHFRTGKKQ